MAVKLHKDKPTYGISRDGYSAWKALPDGSIPIYINKLWNLNTSGGVGIEFEYFASSNAYGEKQAREISKEEFDKIWKAYKYKVHKTLT